MEPTIAAVTRPTAPSATCAPPAGARGTVKEELRAEPARAARGRGADLPGRRRLRGDGRCPPIENAILAGQDLVFLGERGQAKTRMARLLVGLLDRVAAGRPTAASSTTTRSHRSAPAARAIVERARRRRRRSTGCPATAATPRSWRRPTSPSPTSSARSTRSSVAEGRYLSDELTLHYGLIPRCQPRHRRDQRAAGPRRADPGRPPQHPRGARRPDPRLHRSGCRSTCTSSRRPTRRTTRSRGRIITPLKDRLGLADPDPLPAHARARDRDRPRRRSTGSRPRTAYRRSSCPAFMEELRRRADPPGPTLAGDQPALRRQSVRVSVANAGGPARRPRSSARFASARLSAAPRVSDLGAVDRVDRRARSSSSRWATSRRRSGSSSG